MTIFRPWRWTNPRNRPDRRSTTYGHLDAARRTFPSTLTAATCLVLLAGAGLLVSRSSGSPDVSGASPSQT